MMKALFTLMVLVLTLTNVSASTTTAISSGDWGEAANWTNGSPGCIDTIIIPAGIQIDITSTVNLEGCFPGLDSIVVLISGTLEFQNGKKLLLPCDSDVYIGAGGTIGVGSGGGSSTYIEICSSQYWNAAGGDLTGPSSLCDGGCVTLPIELISFTAVRNEPKRRVDLKWVTLSETENDYFTIERSSDAINWTEIGTHDGAGTSSIQLTYESYDFNSLSGISYYRLKQTDFNGAFAYSPIVSLQQNLTDEIFVYPNPAHSFDEIVVSFPNKSNGRQNIKIVNISGQSIYEVERDITESKQAIVRLPVNISGGTYFLCFGESTVKLVIL